MSITYTPTTNFGAKDSLPANDPAKVIKGAEFTTEYTAIQSAFALAAPAASPTITGTATFDDVSITNGLTVDGTTLVVDDVNNNVGIGTDSPVAPLDVRAAADVHVGIDDQSGTALIYAANDADQTSVVPMKFQANSFIFNGASERMRIDSSGNVGIGTDTPSFATGSGLEIQRVAADATLRLENTGNTAFELTAEADVVTYNSVSTKPHVFEVGSVERMRIDSSGNVGIGTDSPGVALDVNGGSNTQIRLTASDSLGSSIVNFGDQSNVAVGRLVYSHVSDSFSFKTNNVNDRMVIDSSGNLGIGTSTPLNKLVVSEGTGQHGIEFSPGTLSYIQAYDRATADYSDLKIDAQTVAFGTDNGVERMRIDNVGNVGIGTDSPGQKLEVAAATGTLAVSSTTSGNSSRLFMFNTTDGLYAELGNDGSDMIFKPQGGERMRIDGVGNVGIGTAAIPGGPDRQLYVKDTQSRNTAAKFETTVAGAYAAFADVNTTLGQLPVRFGAQGDDAIIYAGNTEKMRVNSSGNVGIGTSAPTADLDVRKVTEATLAVKNTAGQGAEISGSASGAEFGSPNSIPVIFNTAGTERMRIDSSGNLLVGTTSTPTGATNGVQINASEIRTSRGTTSSVVHFRFFNANGQVGNISTSGSTTAYATSSDERLKENIVDAPAGNIDALQVRSFDWKADGERQTYGFIAQELEEAAPYAVTKGETEDDMWAVDYSKLVPMLVKEIQDLKAEVEALKNA